MSYVAKIPAKVTYNDGTSDLTKSSNYSFIVNTQLVNEIKELGELIDPSKGEDAGWQYDLFTGSELSAVEFWKHVNANTHMQFCSSYDKFWFLDSDNVRDTSIYKLLKTGGASLSVLTKSELTSNTTGTWVDTVKGTTAGSANCYINDKGVNDFNIWFLINGREYGNVYHSLCPASIHYVKGLDIQLRPYNNFQISFVVFDNTIIDNNESGSNIKIVDLTKQLASVITIDGVFEGDAGTSTNIKSVSIHGETKPIAKILQSVFVSYWNEYQLTQGEDIDDNFNPYMPGRSDNTGGDGKYDDETQIVPKPTLPEVDVTDAGLVTAYKCTMGDLKELANYLLSDSFNLENFKKLYANPMDSIIGITCIPIVPTTGRSKRISFGGLSSSLSLPVITEQFKEINMGSITIEPYWDNFADYEPYTSIKIYLPFIGFKDLDPSDVMGRTLSIEYRFDVITGGCVAMINVSDKGYIYTFSGSALSTIPVTSLDMSQAYTGVANTVTGGGNVLGNALTGSIGGALSGMGSMIHSAVIQSGTRPVEHSGQVSGTSGLMGIKRVFVIITRPRQCLPNALPSLRGLASCFSSRLSALHGFTQVDDIHLEGLNCTEQEKSEIESLLKQGVIL